MSNSLGGRVALFQPTAPVGRGANAPIGCWQKVAVLTILRRFAQLKDLHRLEIVFIDDRSYVLSCSASGRRASDHAALAFHQNRVVQP
jgi:hypothetical protein